MISLDSSIWKELDSAGSDTDEILRDLMEGKGDFRENMESLGWDLSHQACYYDATAYVLPHLAVLCTKLSPEDKAFLITEIGLAIAAEGVWPIKPDTEAFREFQEGLRGLRRICTNFSEMPINQWFHIFQTIQFSIKLYKIIHIKDK